MIDVWNKVDLVTTEDLYQLNDPDSKKVSCLTGYGMKELFVFIENKLNEITKAKPYVVEYGLENHEKIIKWLRENTNISF
jgi:50S ribosomal subunit-associated GTPase HflX